MPGKSLVLAAALALAAGPACAQFASPVGEPWIVAAPGLAYGAGQNGGIAGGDDAANQSCQLVPSGRSGSRYQCAPQQTAPRKR